MDRFNLGVAFAVGVLAKGDLFAAELSAKLADYDPEDREQILQHCFRRGFLDEQRTARNFVSKHQGKKGPEWIRAKLCGRGAPEEVVDEALGAADFDAVSVLTQKFPQRMEPAKAARFLASRGFSEEAIANALASLQMTD